MIILTIRTDKPDAEISLYQDKTLLTHVIWKAHRELAETIHKKISDMLLSVEMDWSDIKAVVAFKGPGSFTGLRIGISVANALAYGLNIPIVAKNGETWQHQGIDELMNNVDQKNVIPEYGAGAHITMPRK